MLKCPECQLELKDKKSCPCGWKATREEKPVFIRNCCRCFSTIRDGYFRVLKDSGNSICGKCLHPFELDWRDKHYLDWLEKHPEFKFKPVTEQDQKDMQEMAMAYIRKITKGGSSARLPYDKTKREITFNELEDKELFE